MTDSASNEVPTEPTVVFDKQTVRQLEAIRSRFPFPKAAMVPVLRRVQELRGWIDDEAQRWVAEFLSVQPIEVYEVVSFYPMLYGQPVGRHVIHVCRTLCCDISGNKELWEHLEQKLGVGRNGTTDDGRYTLKAAECLASCGTPPVMLINNARHENLTHAQADALLEECK
jgi:NADH-quinone oxidoreductase subunit E